MREDLEEDLNTVKLVDPFQPLETAVLCGGKFTSNLDHGGHEPKGVGFKDWSCVKLTIGLPLQGSRCTVQPIYVFSCLSRDCRETRKLHRPPTYLFSTRLHIFTIQFVCTFIFFKIFGKIEATVFVELSLYQ